MTTTIAEYYAHKNINSYPSKHGIDNTLPLPEWLVGLELEIEGFNPEIERRFGGFTFTEDGSLRAREGGVGIEAISLPVATKFVPALLTAFYDKFQIGEKNYTERCSTHVHFNALPLTFDQVSTISLLYQTVEDLLFKYVGHDRDQSIFCVPWNQSNLSYSVVNKLSKSNDHTHEVFRRWQKYSALNLIPLTTQGTLEFRHLHGTRDVKVITTWIALLSKLFEYALNVDLEKAKYQIVNMNTVSNYHEWLNNVFGKWADALRCEGFEAVLSQGVINSKLMLNKIDEPAYTWRPVEPPQQDEFLRAVERTRRQVAQAAAPAATTNAIAAETVNLAAGTFTINPGEFWRGTAPIPRPTVADQLRAAEAGRRPFTPSPRARDERARPQQFQVRPEPWPVPVDILNDEEEGNF